MRIQEERHPNEPWLLWKIGNWTAIDDAYIESIGFAWIFKEDGKWIFKPRVTENVSLFYNAIFFLRLSLPAGIFASFRWSGTQTERAIFQTGVGWKLNGRLAILFRFQSDKSSAEGTTGPNHGQATGFNYGTH